MDDHGHTVKREAHVQLESVRAVFKRSLEGCQSILGRQSRSPAMSNDERPGPENCFGMFQEKERLAYLSVLAICRLLVTCLSFMSTVPRFIFSCAQTGNRRLSSVIQIESFPSDRII